MKRKYFSVLLMAAMTMASTSMVTSCKDYDDDINSVQTQVDAANDLIKKLTEQATTLQTAVNTAQSTADAAKTAAAEAASAAKAAQETGNEALAQAKTAEANAQAAKAAAAEAQKAAIAEATKQVNALKEEVQAALNNKVDVATFNDTVAKLEGDIAGIDNNLNKLGDDVKQNQADIKTAKDAIATLEAAQKDAAIQIAALEAYKKTLENSTIPGLNEAIKANGVKIDGNTKSIEDLKKATEDAQKKLADNIADVAKDLTALEATVKGIDQAYKDADAQLKQDIETLLNDAKTKHDQDVSAINGKIDDINTLIANNKTELKKYTDDEVKKVKDDLQDQINQLAKLNIDGTEKGLTELFKEVNQKFDNYYTTGQIDQKITDLTTNYTTAINTAISTAKTEIKDAQKKITDGLTADINILHILVAQRLSSLVFAPTTYIDGVEAIKFASLEYYDWGNDWERDAATEDDENHVIIRDQETIAKYLLNPTGVSLDDIEGFDFISSKASNVAAGTRAAVAPIKVAGSKVEDGMLSLNVQKTGNASFGTSNTDFTIVSLQAKLNQNVLTEEEKKAGKSVYVYSDWARLYETSTRPYIHNALATASDGKAVEDNAASHFWKYSEVYNGKTKATELPWIFNKKHIVKQVPYNKEIDLLSLVEVCDKNKTIYTPESYGLSFEFHLIDYKLKNENQTTDATNQIYFGKLKADGHTLISTSRDGKEQNRDAIGRQPMIQAVLKEGDKVVDVRYFKIQWVAEQKVEDYGNLLKDTNIEKKYSCGNEESFVVNEEYVNSLYSFKDLSRNEFHNSYYLDSHLWTSKELAADGVASKALQQAAIKDLADWQDAGQTHNLKFTFNFDEAPFKFTQADYDKGSKTATVYGCFVSKTNYMDKVIFSLTVDITVDKMAYADGMNYSQEQWTPENLTMANGLNNTAKARTVNPSLRSDAKYGIEAGYTDVQLVGDLKAGYVKDGQVPSSIAKLVKNATNVAITFDANRLDEVATATGTAKSAWAVSNDGYTLTYNSVKAATINTSGDIKLAENGKPGKGGQPTAGALLLVGKNVPVVIGSSYCGLNQTIDKYLVSFITPLEMNIDEITENLKDIIDGGSSSVSIVNKVHVREAFGLKRTVLGPNKTGESTSDELKSELKSWYIVSDANWDTSNAVTNLTKDGSISSSTNLSSWTKLSDLKGADGKVKYTLKHNATAGTVTFHNMSGNAIAQSFKVAIPVKVTTKWHNFTQYVEITVEKGF